MLKICAVTERYIDGNEVYLFSMQLKTRSHLIVQILFFYFLLNYSTYDFEDVRICILFSSLRNQERNILQLEMSVIYLCKFCPKHC
jgi:hypothetical protein